MHEIFIWETWTSFGWLLMFVHSVCIVFFSYIHFQLQLVNVADTFSRRVEWKSAAAIFHFLFICEKCKSHSHMFAEEREFPADDWF